MTQITQKRTPAAIIESIVQGGHPVVVDVDVDLARHLLTLNTENRKLRREQVNRIARDIAHGNWVFDGNPLVLDTAGNLVAGQHRCHALVEADRMHSGATIKAVIVTGASPDTVLTSNSGMVTTPGDVLSMRGISNSSNVAAAARLLYAYETGAGAMNTRTRLPGRTKLTSQELIGFLVTHPDLEESVRASRGLIKSIALPPTPVAVAHYVLMHKDTEQAEDFFHRISNMSFRGPEDPLMLLVQRAQRETLATRGGVVPTAALFLIFRAWNAWRTDEKLIRYQLYKNNGQPQTLPHLV